MLVNGQHIPKIAPSWEECGPPSEYMVPQAHMSLPPQMTSQSVQQF